MRRSLSLPVTHLRAGLAISREVIQAHGGVVEVESKLGVGSTFYINLPLVVLPLVSRENEPHDTTASPLLAKSSAAAEQARPPDATSEVDVRPAANPEPTTRRALVVDDVPSNRKLFAMHIKKLGFTITEAENGREALDACGVDCGVMRGDEEPFSVVFMDSVRLVPRSLTLDSLGHASHGWSRGDGAPSRGWL